LGKDEFEKATEDAFDKAKAGAKVVKKMTEGAAKDLGNKVEKVRDNFEAEYRKQKWRIDEK
jgi:hypothetical protein